VLVVRIHRFAPARGRGAPFACWSPPNFHLHHSVTCHCALPCVVRWFASAPMDFPPFKPWLSGDVAVATYGLSPRIFIPTLFRARSALGSGFRSRAGPLRTAPPPFWRRRLFRVRWLCVHASRAAFKPHSLSRCVSPHAMIRAPLRFLSYPPLGPRCAWPLHFMSLP
jgi:hypothetical protein